MNINTVVLNDRLLLSISGYYWLYFDLIFYYLYKRKNIIFFIDIECTFIFVVGERPVFATPISTQLQSRQLILELLEAGAVTDQSSHRYNNSGIFLSFFVSVRSADTPPRH